MPHAELQSVAAPPLALGCVGPKKTTLAANFQSAGIGRAEVVKAIDRPTGRLAWKPSTIGWLAGVSDFHAIKKFAPEPPESSLRGTKIS